MDLERDLTRVLHERSTATALPDVVASVHAGMRRRRRRQRLAQAGAALSVTAVAVAGGLVLTSGAGSSPASLGSRVPQGFQVSDLTFVSTTKGYALGSVPCAGGSCTILLRTESAAGDWQRFRAPAAGVASPDGVLPSDCGARPCVSQVRFARDAAGEEVGYAFGPGFAVTTDDAESWTSQPAATAVEALEASGGSMVRVRQRPGGGHLVERAAVGRTDWAVEAEVADTSPDVLLRRQGSRVLLTVGAAVRYSLDGGDTWRTGSPAACGEGASFTWAALGKEHEVVALCSRRTGSFVRQSVDDGATFGPALPLPDGLAATQVVAPSGGGWLVAADQADGRRVLVDSRDRGATWPEVASQEPGNGVPVAGGYLDNSSSSALWWVGPDARVIHRSQDGGDTWTSATFH